MVELKIVRNNQTGQEKHILYIGGTPYESNIVYLKDYAESSGSYKFLHKDYLGSILAISDEAGNAVEQRHYDAWGNFTHLKVGTQAMVVGIQQVTDYLATSNLLLDRGYTSHEHFSEVGLIHMNGRLYDPMLRRFLNADENIQDMYNTQNYNKYGYVMNNPLMYNDPSGEVFEWVALGVAALIGAAIGAATYLIMTLPSGQFTFGGFFKSILMGAVSGAVSFGVGSIFSSTAGTLTTIGSSIKETLGGVGLAMVQAGTHAISQGVMSLVQGGNFLSGAASGFFGSLGAAGWGAGMKSIGLEKFAGNIGGTVLSGAVLGGVGSVLTGGNFWEGAVIGGIVAGLNHSMHKMEQPLAEGNEVKTTNAENSPDDIIVLNAPTGASGLGHNAVIIGNDKDGYVYISKDGRADGSLPMGGNSKNTVMTFKTKREALNFANSKYKFDNVLTIKTNRSQDIKAIANAHYEAKKGYHVIYNNCSDIPAAALQGAGLNWVGGTSVISNTNFYEMKILNFFRSK